jgi:hypothetical protein
MTLLPAYSIVPRFNWEDLFQKLETLTGEKTEAFEDAAGKTFSAEGWQRILLDSLFRREGRATFNRNQILKFYLPNKGWSKWFHRERRIAILSVSQVVEEITEVYHDDFDEANLLKDPDYRPDRYDKNGNHLCNVYGMTLRSKFRFYLDDAPLRDFDILSASEIWTPYKFKLGKFEPNVQEFKKWYY